MSFIEVNNICKTFKVAQRKSGFTEAIKSFFKREYKYIKAIENISFSIDEGEIVGYIGPNGAGKSTTIKILSGILTPDSGLCKVNGIVPWKERKKYVSSIGVVFGQRSQLWWDIPAMDTFDLLKDVYDIEDSKYQKIKNELIKMLDIEDIVTIPVRQLSLGQRMRCEIVASLLHEPKILFLDEPTIGLDAVSKKIVRDFIKKINKEKKVTIILTTHDMADIEFLANRIIMIGKGKVLYDGTINKIKKIYDKEKIIKVVSNDDLDIDIKGISDIKHKDSKYVFKIDTEELPLSKFIKEVSKFDIIDLDVENQNIDDVILKLYEELLWLN